VVVVVVDEDDIPVGMLDIVDVEDDVEDDVDEGGMVDIVDNNYAETVMDLNIVVVVVAVWYVSTCDLVVMIMDLAWIPRCTFAYYLYFLYLYYLYHHLHF